MARSTSERRKSQSSVLLMAVMIPTVLVLMVAHGIEVIVWSFAYAIVSAAADDANLVYFAFVNYTTLGYGDVLPLPRWRLLGPITAMNGVLLFGWSTAVIFEVLRRTLARTPGFRERSKIRPWFRAPAREKSDCQRRRRLLRGHALRNCPARRCFGGQIARSKLARRLD